MSEVAITGGAAVSLNDMEHMHHSPNSSIHDDSMGIDCTAGYVEADKLMDYENFNTIDEEAMENDFDQLINLEGGSGMDSMFSESLAEVVDSGTDGYMSSVCGEGGSWAGLTMPVLGEEDVTPPGQGVSDHDLHMKLVAKMTTTVNETGRVKERLLGSVKHEHDDHEIR